MKEFLLFTLPACPYCRQALAWQSQLFARCPQYAPLAPRVVDESKEPELARKMGYDLVPCYFWGGEKLAEGVLTPEKIEEVFRRVYSEVQAKS